MSAWALVSMLAALGLAGSPGLAGAGRQPPGAPVAPSPGAPKPASALIDINSASRGQLKTLPGVGDAEADKIIAGRPYLSKAGLVTAHALPAGVYQAIRHRIVAVQKTMPERRALQAQTPGPAKATGAQ